MAEGFQTGPAGLVQAALPPTFCFAAQISVREGEGKMGRIRIFKSAVPLLRVIKIREDLPISPA